MNIPLFRVGDVIKIDKEKWEVVELFNNRGGNIYDLKNLETNVLQAMTEEHIDNHGYVVKFAGEKLEHLAKVYNLEKYREKRNAQ